MRFRLDTSPFNQFCVVAGDNEFYIPKEGGSSYNASDIATLLINANNLHPIDDSPWIEIELDKLPRLCFATRMGPQIIAVGTLGLVGTLRMNQMSSSNDKTLALSGQDFSIYEAREVMGHIVSTLSITATADMDFKLESSITSNHLETKFQLNPPNNFTVGGTPQNDWQIAYYENWEIETKMGFRAEGQFYPTYDPKASSFNPENYPIGIVEAPGMPPINMDRETLKRTIATKAGLAISFCIASEGRCILKGRSLLRVQGAAGGNYGTSDFISDVFSVGTAY